MIGHFRRIGDGSSSATTAAAHRRFVIAISRARSDAMSLHMRESTDTRTRFVPQPRGTSFLDDRATPGLPRIL